LGTSTSKPYGKQQMYARLYPAMKLAWVLGISVPFSEEVAEFNEMWLSKDNMALYAINQLFLTSEIEKELLYEGTSIMQPWYGFNDNQFFYVTPEEVRIEFQSLLREFWTEPV